MSPDGKHLSVFCTDGYLHIWDWANAKQTGKVAGAASGVGRTTYYDEDGFAYSSSSSAAFEGPVYSPDGKTLLLVVSSRVLRFVDLPTGKEIDPDLGHTESLTSISFTPDGSQIVTKDAKSTRTWNAATGKDLGAVTTTLPTMPAAGSPTVISPDGHVGVWVASFASPAAARAATARDAVLFDATSGKKLSDIALEPEITPIHRGPLVFSPDSKMLAVAGVATKQKIELYEVPSGKLLRTLDAEPGAPAAQRT